MIAWAVSWRLSPVNHPNDPAFDVAVLECRTKEFGKKLPHAKGLTIQSSLFSQETHLAVRVTSYKTHNHSLLLTPLEAIHATKFNAREFLFQRCKRGELALTSQH
jgi:hypothetical protein